MAINKKFVAKNGLDNNNQILTNIATPVAQTDASNKGYVESFASNATNITSGTLASTRLPAFTGGDVTSTVGSSVLTLVNSGATAGNYTNANITVDSKGRITSVSNGSGATGLTSGSASTGYLTYSGTTSTAGQLNGGTTNPSATTRLNYNGDMYVHALHVTDATVSLLRLSGSNGATVEVKNAANTDYAFMALNGSIVSLGTKRATANAVTELVRLENTTATVQGSLTVNGTISATAYSGVVTSFNSRSGAVSLSSSDVTGALGYTPYNSTNPNGYTSNTGTVTSVSSGAGMNFTGISTSGTVAMGTPSTCTPSTTNSASGTTHTHTISIPLANYTANGLIAGSGTQYISGTKSFQTSYVEIKNGTTEAQLAVGSSGTYLYGTASSFGFYNPTTVKGFQFTPSTGNATLSGTLTQNSDITIKYNLEKIPNALSKVCQINGYTYNRKGISDREMGVIAQEVELVAPELISIGDDDIRSVAYGNTIALLIEAIKELKKEVDFLKSSKV